MSQDFIMDLIDKLELKLECEFSYEGNPDMLNTCPMGTLDYKCKLKSKYDEIDFYFSLGPYYNTPPDIPIVLRSLVFDSIMGCFEFDYWCEQLNVDIHDKLAQNAYNKIQERIPIMLNLLGLHESDEYEGVTDIDILTDFYNKEIMGLKCEIA